VGGGCVFRGFAAGGRIMRFYKVFGSDGRLLSEFRTFEEASEYLAIIIALGDPGAYISE
jgi:hypothetical protein